MSFTFTDAKPVERANPGRTAEPNPFVEVVASIALKLDGDTPVARAFTLTHDADPEKRKASIEKVKRQLSAAGKGNDPKVSVHVAVNPVKKGNKDSETESVVTFWTKPFIARTRKTNETNATAS